MKYIAPLFLLFAIFITPFSASSQKYKKIEDTTKLNKEYTTVNNEIAELKARLLIAQNGLPGYQSKARDANEDAVNAASSSSDQAKKAKNGSIKDAKSAKRKANKSYEQAKDSKSAKKKVNNEEDKIAEYIQDIDKKQTRISELDKMRLEIQAKLPTDSIPKS